MVRKRFGERSGSWPKKHTGKESDGLTETETSPDNVDITVEQLANTDRGIDEVTSAPRDIFSPYEPRAPRVVEPPARVPADSPAQAPADNPARVPAVRVGQVAAIITAFVLLAGVVGLGAIVISDRNGAPIKIESVVESVDATNGCEWQLAIELRNNSDQPLIVERFGAILNRGQRTSTMRQAPIVAPGEAGTFLVAFRLPAGDGCPAADQINHGNLIVHLQGGSSESLRF